jgi:hypothetical protein
VGNGKIEEFLVRPFVHEHLCGIDTRLRTFQQHESGMAARRCGGQSPGVLWIDDTHQGDVWKKVVDQLTARQPCEGDACPQHLERAVEAFAGCFSHEPGSSGRRVLSVKLRTHGVQRFGEQPICVRS